MQIMCKKEVVDIEGIIWPDPPHRQYVKHLSPVSDVNPWTYQSSAGPIAGHIVLENSSTFKIALC